MEPMKEEQMEFKAGDVALIEAGCWANRKVGLRLDEGWSHTNGVSLDGDGVVSPVRRLVVIDPESVEDVERLVNILRSIEYVDLDLNESLTMGGWRLRAALREYVTTTPEPLAEPMNLAARVLDRNGQPWTRVGGRWWASVDGAKEWAELTEDDGPLRLADES